MAEQPQFTFTLEQKQDMQFLVKFDSDEFDDLLLDEPEPIGSGKGPNASRILGAAVANCLSASLLFCLRKARQEPASIKATVTGHMTRNEQKRLRVGGFDVSIEVSGIDREAAGSRRCLELFEDFCVVTASIRKGLPVSVKVVDEAGERLF
jgi:uncharacterized OsmC-like protein